ncbi:MAG TPA: hypothetical protein VL947_04995, partial [Cytophagales bacterium]|nr:hypothetical protein [Cytophagales bacterium]
ALIVQVLVSMVFLAVTHWAAPGIGLLILFIFGYLACLGFIAPNTSALTMAPFSKNAGSASSLLGALQMSLGGIVSIGTSVVAIHSALPLALVMTAASVLAFIILITCSRYIKENNNGAIPTAAA